MLLGMDMLARVALSVPVSAKSKKAKLMDHGSYEWSQYWRKPYGKFRRNATRYSKRKEKTNEQS